MTEIQNKVAVRLMRYAKINTASNPHAHRFPTTERQKDLALCLEEELRSIGVEEILFDSKKCILYAFLPSTLPPDKTAPAIGLIAHLDTSPEANSEGVSPRLVECYDGGDILLNDEKGTTMSSEKFPVLKNYVGQDLIVSDGTTLLGADDKAAIAAIVTFAEELCKQPQMPHGRICLAFTPDEEVGGLARDLDLERFGAAFAFTVDCDHLGHYSEQTFYASEAVVTIQGLAVHPGTAKGIMKNAAEIAAEFIGLLPQREKPQYTDGLEGFYYVVRSQATCEKGVIELIVREFDKTLFQSKNAYLEQCCQRLNQKYGKNTISISIHEQYRNMMEVMKDYPEVTQKLKTAIEQSGLEAVCEPFRGGTDGAALSFRGLPCPNLSAGYENAHSNFEFACVQSMEKNVEILKNLVGLFIEPLA